MSGTITKIFQKAPVVSVGAWVTAGGAGSLTDVGYTEGGVEISVNHEDTVISPDQEPGNVAHFPVMTDFSMKFTMLEATVDNLLTALRQAAANKTGTTPDFTLEIGEGSEAYLQIQLVGKGGGTTGVRTVTVWRGIVASVEPIGQKKNEPTKVAVTVNCLRDPSVSAAGKHMKLVET